MRQKIINIIQSIGLDINDFVIGEGAREQSKEVHYRPYRYRPFRGPRKEFLIQYCNNVLAIWEIGKRVDMKASIDLRCEGIEWSDIDKLQIFQIGIRGEKEKTEAAVMPIEAFESYLKFRFSIDDKESFYANYLEGGKIEIFSTRYERNSKLRKKAIEIHGLKCEVCGFSFEETYGEIGKNYIEVHHIKPISEGEREVDPRTDLVCLCSNCHRMIHHQKKRVLSVDELKGMISFQK